MENFREKRLERQLKSQQTTSIVIGVILILSIIGNVFLLIRNNRLSDDADTVRQERNIAISEREASEERVSQLGNQIQSLEQQVNELREINADLESEIQVRDRRIAQLRRQFPEIEQELEKHIAQLEELEGEYATLQEEREELRAKMESLEEELSDLRSQYDAQAALIDEATFLQAYNISVVNLRDRWLWGRPVYMEDAGRISRTLISFEINSNILVEPATKDVHLLMLDPDGEVINPSTDNFTIAESGESRNYTAHTTINYDQQRMPVSFEILHDDRLSEGDYTIEAYIDGDYAGSKVIQLD